MPGQRTTALGEPLRDAQRSRDAILEAAAHLFAERGYAGATLAEIAFEADLARSTPSYFFGAKEKLYLAVLDRAFRARQTAMQDAFIDVHEWCADPDRGLGDLHTALGYAVEHYLDFLVDHTQFVRLVLHEELDGGRRMAARAASSTAMEDAFGALRRVAPERGLGYFAVPDAIGVFIGLTFTAVALSHTFMPALRRDLTQDEDMRRQIELAVTALLAVIAGPR